MIRFFWKTLGAISLLLGIIGIFVPLLPTTPFLILAAFAFERGSERVHQWLVNHPRFGPAIENWRRYGAISSKAKTMAVVGILFVFGISIVLSIPLYALALQAIVLSCVSLFILTRPNPPA